MDAILVLLFMSFFSGVLGFALWAVETLWEWYDRKSAPGRYSKGRKANKSRTFYHD